VLVAAGVGLVGELAALGLLTTGAWLLLSASLRPPILLLSIAIGAVQLFSFLRGTARFVERLASHSLGLSLQAELRAWLYRRLAQLVPCGLPGGDRGDLLTRLIRDTEEAQDLVVRAAVPVLAAAAAWAAAVVTAVALLPPAGWAILAAGISRRRASPSRGSSPTGRRQSFRLHEVPSPRGPSAPSPPGRNWPPSGPWNGPWTNSPSASRSSALAPEPPPPLPGWAAARACSPGEPGWPGWPGPARRRFEPRRSAPSSSASWSSWRWASPPCSRACPTPSAACPSVWPP
jgi:hypothetical protein